MSTGWHRIANIDVLCRLSSQPGPAVVLLHGYGADAGDLFSLSQALGSRSDISWYFPNGFLRVPLGGGVSGRAWFAVDVEELQKKMREGRHSDLAATRPEGIGRASREVEAVLAELGARHSAIVLGGFSQGAMVATDVTLRQRFQPVATILFSGLLLDREAWSKAAKECQTQRFFQSHGRSDPILSFAGGEDLYHLLREAGKNIEFHAFSGGHEIPVELIAPARRFIQATFG